MTEPSGIHAAIAKVYEKVAYVQKSRTLSTGQGGGYKFAGEADFIEALRPAMVEAGIYVHVNRVRDIRQEVFTSTKGAVQNRVTLIATVRFTHTDGSFIESEATGEGMDSGDKASNKAMTGALKYALRQTFCIETGTDPDDTPSSEQARDTAPRQNTPARAPERATAPVLSKEKIRETYTDYLQSITEATLKASDAAVIVGELTKDNAIEKIATYILTTPDMTVAKLVGMIIDKKQQEAA